MVGIINFVLYVEMAKFFYINKGELDIRADGIIDIIISILNLGLIFYLFYKERETIYRS